MILTFRGFGFPIGIGSARPSSMKRSILVLLFLTISNRSQGRNSFPTLFLPELRSKKKPYSGVRLSKSELILHQLSFIKMLRLAVRNSRLSLTSGTACLWNERIFLGPPLQLVASGLRPSIRQHPSTKLDSQELIFGFQSSKTLRALVTALLVTLNSSIPVSSKQRIFLWHILKAKHTLRQRLFMRLFAST